MNKRPRYNSACPTWLTRLILVTFLVFSGMTVCAQESQDELDSDLLIIEPPVWPTAIFEQNQPPPTPTEVPSAPRVATPPARTFTSTSRPRSRSLFQTLWRSSERTPNSRLASIPHMFGDFVDSDPQYSEENGGVKTLVTDLPLIAGSRVKIADNNSAVAMNRAYFMYQHFHNALQFDSDPSAITRPSSGSIDRLVVGLERVILDGDASIDFRLPVYSSFGFPGAPFGGFDGGTLGNLTITPKFALLSSESSVLSAGMGVHIPTGDDTTIQSTGNILTVHNDAVHLLPFLGYSTAPGDVSFLQIFAQFDLATNGNGVEVTDTIFGNISRAGIFTEQNLFHADLMGGHWLWRDSASALSGLAVLLELHYTSTLQDTDIVSSPTLFGSTVSLLNSGNRQDLFNLTTGIHTQVGDRTTIRLGAVFPLGKDDNRFFDSELNLQLNRQF